MYADDMTGLVIGISSIKELMKLMEDFKLQSGLGVNNDKTEILPLGIQNFTTRIQNSRIHESNWSSLHI